jgi:hypothetical protein
MRRSCYIATGFFRSLDWQDRSIHPISHRSRGVHLRCSHVVVARPPGIADLNPRAIVDRDNLGR